MRILWSSNASFCLSGYGIQTRYAIAALQALGHEVIEHAIVGVIGAPIPAPGGHCILPRGEGAFGQQTLSLACEACEADLLITLYDAWVLRPDLYPERTIWLPWVPVDHAQVPPGVREVIGHAQQVVAMSAHGACQIAAALPALAPVHTIPHAVDTGIFWPMNRDSCREGTGLRTDAYTYGMVAANDRRKCIEETIDAFARIHARYADTQLYLHTADRGPMSQGALSELIAALGLELGRDVIMADAWRYHAGLYSMEDMARLYNAMDCLLMPSLGEGFGVPLIEAQACGTPVICGGWTSMLELCRYGSVIPVAESERYWTDLGSYQYRPHVGAICRRMEEWYRRGRRVEGSDPERIEGSKAMGDYALSAWGERYWKPLMERIHGGV